jgi:hypothetical protein
VRPGLFNGEYGIKEDFMAIFLPDVTGVRGDVSIPYKYFARYSGDATLVIFA